MIFDLVITQKPLNRIAEFEELSSEYLKILPEFGRKFIGAWRTVVPQTVPAEIVHLVGYESWEARAKCLENMNKDKEFQKFLQSYLDTTISNYIRIMEPMPYSPNKSF